MVPGVLRGAPAGRRALQVTCRSKLARKNSTVTVDSSAAVPQPNYLELLTQRQRQPGACPALFLAPMENLADRPMRMALARTVGGFDEACTEFIRIPGKCEAKHVPAMLKGVCTGYDPCELSPTPLGAQIMGSSPELLAEAARYLVDRGAPRVDLNCGCPANTVTGHGAGSSLLKTPHQLEAIVSAMVAAVGQLAPVSVKLRAGFNDTSLFEDNLLAAQAGGAAFVAIHPRTKAQAYQGRADWGCIAAAKQLLHIPVIGNGDVLCPDSAQRLLSETGCDGIMIGRGAIQDPLIFHRIRAAMAPVMAAPGAGEPSVACISSSSGSSGSNGSSSSSSNSSSPGSSGSWDWSASEAAAMQAFLCLYAGSGYGQGASGAHILTERGQFGRLKKTIKYLFSGQHELLEACNHLLRAQHDQMTSQQLLEQICEQIERHWQQGGPQRRALINHMGGGKPGGGAAAAS